jgi:hypothetical protein
MPSELSEHRGIDASAFDTAWRSMPSFRAISD